jgi:hypothetical protein
MLAFIIDLVFVFPFVNRLICIAFFSLTESCKPKFQRFSVDVNIPVCRLIRLRASA